ncbi:CHASE domain-containing protein [Dongia sp.]|jgi:PAS domain S-box-containing protein|uniref:CHASE domain-containing protein n=1 Tax=Dongia sp. TaxID=1977262 RepID=UPI0035B37030
MPERPWQQPVKIGRWSVAYPLALVAGAILYFALARLGLAFATLQESASPIWPASGFAVALLLVGGPRLWPAIAIGAFGANALTGGYFTAAFITIGNTLEGLIGFFIFSRVIGVGTNRFPLVKSFGYLLAALLAPIVSAATGVTALVAAGQLPPALTGSVATTWWAGDAIGILLVLPALINFLKALPQIDRDGAKQANPKIPPPQQIARAALLVLGLGIVSALTAIMPGWTAIFLLALPLLLATARWFGQRGVSLMLLAVAALWIAITAAGLGPFLDNTPNDSLLNMQIILAAVAFIGLILIDIQYQRLSVAVTVLLMGSLIAAAVFLVQMREADAVDTRHIRNLATRLQGHMQDRIGTYINALQGGASFYAATEDVTRAEWRQYVRSLQLLDRFPGINGVGVVLPVEKSKAADFITRARADGAPDFTIKPVPDVPVPDVPATEANVGEHFVILYCEPAELNAAAIGLDLASETLRRQAAIDARNTRRPTITPRITLIQDEKRGAGFLLFLPIYRQPLQSEDAVPSRAVFMGWIDAPFTADAFFGRALTAEARSLNLRIHDGTTTAADKLMFDSRAVDGAPVSAPYQPELTTQLVLADHVFTLAWSRGVAFDAQPRRAPIVICAGMILFAALLAGLVATLATQSERANAYAADMNRALLSSNERLELAAACSRDGIWDIDLVTGKVWISPRYYEMFGYETSAVADIRTFWSSVILPEDEIRSREQFQAMLSGTRDDIDLIQRYRHRDGRILHVHSRGISLKDDAGKVIRAIGVHTDISELVRLEGQFKAAIGVMRDGFGLFDADDRLILFNDGFIDEGTRRAIGDPTGRAFEDIVRAFVEHDMPDAKDPAFDREGWIAWRMERHRNPPAEPLEVKWSGDRWMRISERRTSDGGYVGIWSDVTEIKRLSQLLEGAVDALPDAFAIFDADDRLVVCNDLYVSSKVRAAVGDPIGHRYEDLYRLYAELELNLTDPAARDAWLAVRLAQHRNPGEEPYEVVTGDQRVLRVQERRTSNGCIVGLWSDITALRMAERRLNDAIASINEGFVLLDADLRYVIYNDEFLRLYPKMAPYVSVGARFEDVLREGVRAGEYPELSTEADAEAFIAEWIARYRDPTAYQGEGAFADGRWVLIGHHGTSDGGCVNVYTDITALKQREADLAAAKGRLEKQAEQLIRLTEDLRKAREAADASNISKSHFLANMSHELRTPLNAILGFSEIIKNGMFGPVSPPQYREYAEDIFKSGSHLLTLINDILDLSKIEADRMELNIVPLETTSFVAQAVRLVEVLAKERNVRLDASNISECPVIHADERQARQILLNLLSNAIKFTPDGGTVTLSLLDEGDRGSAIKVSDTGIGMTPAEIKRAMERFGQAEPSYSKTTPGTGLGLPLVDGLVRLHGGSLSIESVKGTGTTVTVRLPWHADLYRPKKKARA